MSVHWDPSTSEANNVSKLIMSWRESVPNFGRGILYILLSLGHYSNACLAPGETIRGIVGERLDILCPLYFPNIADQQIILHINSRRMILMEFKKNKIPSIHCTSDHPYKKMCRTQMMNSYADKNNVHFVIDKVPETLNGSTSQCETDYNNDVEKKTRRDPPRIIILRERIKGYVNGTIKIPCPIPNAHREWRVGLKIMNKHLQVWNQSTNTFHCVTGSHYFNVCRNHMNGSSYVNNSTVFFVIENTTALLNNSEVHCFAKNSIINKKNHHDTLEKIITHHEDPSTIISTASTTNKETATTFSEVSPTSTATFHTTTSTIPVASTKAKKKNLTWLWILLALIIIIIIGFVCWCIVYRRCPDNLPSECCRNVCHRIWKCCRGEYEAANQSTELVTVKGHEACPSGLH